MKLLPILQIGCVVLAVTAGIVLTGTRPIRADAPDGLAPAWAVPSAMAVKRVNAVSLHQGESNYFSNVDCSLVTYHLVDDAAMRTGCFTETAYGQIDADSNIVIFNGTDEGLPLTPYAPHQILSPWPKALNLVALDTINTGGSIISMYKNPLGVMQDQRNVLGSLSAKHLTAPPELTLKNSAGQPLIINEQTLAYSDNGSWLVVQVVGGSFVRINLATLVMTPFAPGYGRQASSQLISSAVAVSPNGRYVAVENGDASDFKVYDLSDCVGAICRSYNYWPFVQKQITNLKYISHLRFINAELLSFDASSVAGSAGGSYELAPTASIHSLIDYLGLGDSYSAGEGAFDYLAGTDTGDNVCHLSSHSYPVLLTHDLFTSGGGHSVACSGAVMHDVYNATDTYRGQVRGVADWQGLNRDQPALLASVMANYLPGYVAQQRFVSQYQPAAMTVGVGGNDMGFADILQRCIEPHLTVHIIGQTCYASYEDRQELLHVIAKAGKSLQKLYQQLQVTSPSTTIYIVGYPQIAVDNGSCALNVHFGTVELEFVHELIDRMNVTIASAATAAGTHYVDISQALVGHRLCETASHNVAVNGLTAGKDIGLGSFKFLGGESYHPNILGQQLIEQAILKQTNNLRLSTSTANPALPVPSPGFTNLPKSGRPLTTVIFDSRLSITAAKPGQAITVSLDGLTNGLAPTTRYTIRLDDPQGNQSSAIGTITGDGPVTVIIPPNTEPGVHTIDVTGPNQVGVPIDITKSIIITPRTGGSVCMLVASSGQDADHDGIDDACDPLIGSLGSSNPPSTIPASLAVAVPVPVVVVVPANTVGTKPALVAGATSRSLSTVDQPIRVTERPTSLRLLAAQLPGIAHPMQVKSLPALATIHWLWWLIIGGLSLGSLKLLDAQLQQRRSRALMLYKGGRHCLQ